METNVCDKVVSGPKVVFVISRARYDMDNSVCLGMSRFFIEPLVSGIGNNWRWSPYESHISIKEIDPFVKQPTNRVTNQSRNQSMDKDKQTRLFSHSALLRSNTLPGSFRNPCA